MELVRTLSHRPLTSLLPLALAAIGCLAPLEFGEPVPPTDAQLEAVELMNEAAGLVHSALEGSATDRKAFAMHALLAELHTVAVLGPSPITATGEVPLFHPLCVAGAPSVGYRFDHCHVDDGDAVVHGHMLVDDELADYDLRMSWAEDGANNTALLGNFERIDGRLYGDMELRMSIELPGRGARGGIEPGEGVGHVNVTTEWAVEYDDLRGCITDGYVEIEVEAEGEHHASRYSFDGCNEVAAVQNAER